MQRILNKFYTFKLLHMKKILLIFLGMFAINCIISAQDENPVIVVASEGSIKYIPSDGSKPIKVQAGTVVKSSGSLKIKGGSTAVLLSKGSFKTVKSEGTTQLSTAFQKPKSESATSFDPDFADYIQSSTALIGSKQGVDGWVLGKSINGDGWLAVDPLRSKDGWLAVDPLRSKDGWGAVDPLRSKDGWGDKKPLVENTLPFGKLRETTVPCACAAIPEGKTCTVEILDGDQVVQTTECCQNGQCTVDLKKLKLKKNFRYAWRQKLGTGENALTQSVNFIVLANDDYMNILKRVRTSKVYASGNPTVKGMMEAAAFEQAQLYTEAETIYNRLLDENPKDKMLQINKAALLLRINNEAKAMKVMTK